MAAPRKKKIAAVVKVQLNAGAATPAPPVGTALGPHGVNIMDFCKQYNAATESQRGNVIPVEITIYEDRSFSFITKTPPAPELIKKAAGVAKGSATPHTAKVGSITIAQVREIGALPSAQVALSSHSPAILSRIEPEEVRYFRLKRQGRRAYVRQQRWQ